VNAVTIRRLPHTSIIFYREADLDPDAEENDGHLHLCGICEAAGSNFHEPNGDGERCGE